MSAKGQTNAKRDAVIFIPAIGSWTDQDMEGIALRVTQALEEQAMTEKKFSTKAASNELVYGRGEDKHKSSVHTISMGSIEQAGDAEDIIDLYEMDYGDLFPKEFEKFSLLRKGAYLGGTVFMAVGRAIGAVRRKGISGTDKLHFWFASIVLFGLTVYTGVVGFAALQAVWSTIDSDNQPPSQTVAAPSPGTSQPSPSGTSPPAKNTGSDERAPESNTPGGNSDNADPLTVPQKIALVLTGAGLLTPKARKTLERASIDYVYAVSYLSWQKDRSAMQSQLAALLEEVAETKKYERIHIFAYSFGSLISLDALFPIRNMPKPRFDEIHSLITVGCPVDLVRTFWPKYLDERKAPSEAPRQWINVWAPGDSLSSNFRNDQTDGPAEVSIARRPNGEDVLPTNVPFTVGPVGEELSVPEAFLMRGLRNHSLYWGKTGEGLLDPGCFSDIVSIVWSSRIA